MVLGIGVSVWQVRREALASSPSLPVRQKGAMPSPTPLPTPPQNPSSDYHTCVLSYATEDQTFAEKLHADLRQQGVLCWFAPYDLKTGDKICTQTYEAIGNKGKLLNALSQHSINNLWVEEEVEAALDREHQQPGILMLFPIRLDETVKQTAKAWTVAVRQRYIGDFHQWQDGTAYQQALQRLLRDLHA